VRQSPVRSTRPGCASTERVRRVPHIARWMGHVLTRIALSACCPERETPLISEVPQRAGSQARPAHRIRDTAVPGCVPACHGVPREFHFPDRKA
jgi:hypothetical protein